MSFDAGCAQSRIKMCDACVLMRESFLWRLDLGDA